MGAELAVMAGFGSVLVLIRLAFALVLAFVAVQRHADFEIEITPSSAVKFRMTHPGHGGTSEQEDLSAHRGAVGQIAQGSQHDPAST